MILIPCTASELVVRDGPRVREARQRPGLPVQVIAVKSDVAYRIPKDMSFEDAATLGVGIVTVAQGLFQQMGLDWPTKPSTSGDFVLIYGGSSATGTLGIQFAKL